MKPLSPVIRHFLNTFTFRHKIFTSIHNTCMWEIYHVTLKCKNLRGYTRSMHEFKGVNLLCNFRGDVVWSFFSHVAHVNGNEKNRKKSKIQNFEKQKNGLGIWRKGTFPPNLALICITGSEKTGFTDDGRRATDARVMTVAQLCRAKNRFYHIS